MTESGCNMKLRKRKFSTKPIKDDNSTNLSSDDNSNEEPSIKKTSYEDKNPFPTVPLYLCEDLLSKIPDENKGKLKEFKDNSEHIEKLFRKIWELNGNEYDPGILNKDEENQRRS